MARVLADSGAYVVLMYNKAAVLPHIGVSEADC